VDDIRVAALLYDIGKVEITTRLINKAVDALQASPGELGQGTFQGAELIQSLSAALSPDIMPILDPDSSIYESPSSEDDQLRGETPIGGKIIRTVRAYDDLTEGALGETALSPEQAIRELRTDEAAEHDFEIVKALERSVCPVEGGVVEMAGYSA
jgi:response regulator RpfG family c-di-GMP phosphodiesterase